MNTAPETKPHLFDGESAGRGLADRLMNVPKERAGRIGFAVLFLGGWLYCSWQGGFLGFWACLCTGAVGFWAGGRNAGKTDA